MAKFQAALPREGPFASATGMYEQHPIVWNDEKVARLWDYYARSGVPYFSYLHGRELLRASDLPLSKPLRHLDFGCGPGYIWDHLVKLRSAWRYTGIDFSERSVAKLKAKAEGNPRFDDAFRVEALPTPLPAATFDVVTIIEVVEHLHDEYLHSTLTEATRLLKPGAHLVISTPNDERLEDTHKLCPDCGAVFHEWQHVRSWTPASLQAEVEAYGYALSRTVVTDFSNVGAARKIAHLAKRLLRPACKSPHLLMVFRKST
jgi:2-polyprenyl-3-methyl-5-hydroxy-6-metoxy-1,4-benzoquinol methylase